MMEGKMLGNRYELLEKVGGGGMALVYRARCTLLNRDVAVKILRPEFINDEEFVKRFRVEAQAAASLSHPNIVSIYDVGQEDDIHYIVMEYIDGITLKEYIEEKGALRWEEAINITIQICSAIEQAHRKNIIHRDIKPHNIMCKC
jgi:serine/threonine protein kinase